MIDKIRLIWYNRDALEDRTSPFEVWDELIPGKLNESSGLLAECQ